MSVMTFGIFSNWLVFMHVCLLVVFFFSSCSHTRPFHHVHQIRSTLSSHPNSVIHWLKKVFHINYYVTNYKQILSWLSEWKKQKNPRSKVDTGQRRFFNGTTRLSEPSDPPSSTSIDWIKPLKRKKSFRIYREL